MPSPGFESRHYDTAVSVANHYDYWPHKVSHGCSDFTCLLYVTPAKSYCHFPVWCSKLRITEGVHLALSHDGFRGPRFDITRHSGEMVNIWDTLQSQVLGPQVAFAKLQE
ncbi:hypothetical protein TNCV_3666871 [Trichonephila clavipes]|nr:hypothetical protein TNCV_3666871 [Trichonephila clavipes]